MQTRVKVQRNPFAYGGIARDESFADREAEVDALAADAINGQDVVVFAPRRYGKSSLVDAVTQKLTAEDVLVARIDLMKTPSKEKLADKLAATIYENIASKLERARDAAMRRFTALRIKPVVTLDPDTGAFTFSFSPSSAPADIDETLERLFEMPAEMATEKGKTAVLIVDEFQEILDLDPKLPNLMRAVFQEQAEVSHIYLGSKRHVMERIFQDDNEPFWRSAKPMELGPIPRVPFAKFIAKRFRDTDKDVDDDVLEAILDETGGHPYATQELCYDLWQRTAAGSTASSAELEASMEAMLHIENAHFTLIWEGASGRQRELLEALAQEPGRPFTKAYRQKYGLPETSALQRAVEALTQGELIAKGDDGRYRISEPFFAVWIVENVVKTPPTSSSGDA
jgi:hypothetical protein